MNERNYDIAIVGGGPVGAALAIALSGSGLSVVVLEARAAPGGIDGRTLAMSYGSRLILERLGAWERIEAATAIQSIHVSQRGGFGRTVLTAQDAGLPALGYVVGYSRLQRAIAATAACGESTVADGAEVADVEIAPDSVAVKFRRDGIIRPVHARLLVIADGGAALGSRAGAATKIREYGQDAVVGLVATSSPHRHRAYERFTPDGPVALLPFDDRYALVWTAAPEAATALLGMVQDDFLARLQSHFGDRAGRFLSIESRTRFPLALRYAAETVLPRTVLLGNAAQALHPIAGQGFNLGLRDAWELGEALLNRIESDPGSAKCLSGYRSTRRADRIGGIALTHSLVGIFSNDRSLLRIARGAGLALLDVMPPARRAFLRRMIFGGSI